MRHFGAQYDPALHNTGMLWFGDDGVIITKLDTSSALKQHQYENKILNRKAILWTSQNRMSTENEAGKKVKTIWLVRLRLHLFVQPRSHFPAYYLGLVRVISADGTGPMVVVVDLERELPSDLLTDLWKYIAGTNLDPR